MAEHVHDVGLRLQELRETEGITAEQMAQHIEMPLDEYLKYESGAWQTPVSVLYAVGRYFGVSMNEILTGDRAHLQIFSHLKHQKQTRVEDVAHYSYVALAQHFKSPKIEPLLVEIKAANEGEEIQHNLHDGEEFQYCLSGRYELTINEHKLIIEEGDSIYFDSGHSHCMRALDGQPARLLVIVV